MSVVEDLPEHWLFQGDIEDPGHRHRRQMSVEHPMDTENSHVGDDKPVHVRDVGLPEPEAQQVKPHQHGDPEKTAHRRHENEGGDAETHHADPRQGNHPVLAHFIDDPLILLHQQVTLDIGFEETGNQAHDRLNRRGGRRNERSTRRPRRMS